MTLRLNPAAVDQDAIMLIYQPPNAPPADTMRSRRVKEGPMADDQANADKAFIAEFVEAGKTGHVLPGYARAVGRTKIEPRGSAVVFTPPPPTKNHRQTNTSDPDE